MDFWATFANLQSGTWQATMAPSSVRLLLSRKHSFKGALLSGPEREQLVRRAPVAGGTQGHGGARYSLALSTVLSSEGPRQVGSYLSFQCLSTGTTHTSVHSSDSLCPLGFWGGAGRNGTIHAQSCPTCTQAAQAQSCWLGSSDSLNYEIRMPG